MADEFELSVRWEGDKHLLAALLHTEHNIEVAKRRIPARLADRAESYITINAPGGAFSTIARHTDKTDAYFHPGGAGGGGVWEAQAGVTRIPTIHGPSMYPLYVHEGTANKGRGFIYARDDRLPASVTATGKPRRQIGGVLAIDVGGVRIFRHRIPGQKPNPFVYEAFQRTIIYTRTRIKSIGREIVAGEMVQWPL